MASRAKWELQRVRSGEEGFPDFGRRVGRSVLRRERLLSSMDSAKAEPLPAAAESRVVECQAGLWALKSPMMMVGDVGSRRRERSGLKPGGHEDTGGI